MNPALPERMLIVVLVVLAHALLMWYLVTMPGLPKLMHHEMSVSIANMTTLPQPEMPLEKPRQPRAVADPVAAPAAIPVAAPAAIPVAAPVAAPVAIPVAAPEAPVAAPVLAPVEKHVEKVEAPPPDHEPDYRAAYLNNPAPAYPMVARRMGWQGKVVLNVEVLASGLPGQIKLHQSSGHDVLDNAAMQAVRGWRFTAALQGGQAVTKYFLVPIPFILKED